MTRSPLKLLSFSICSVFFVATVAQAGPIADQAAEIEALLAAEDFAGAGLAADVLYQSVWDATTEISFRQVQLVSEPASGFGIYNPRADAKFKAGEPVIIYAEPYGYGFGTPADGLNSINFDVDLKVLSESGEVLGEMPGLAALELQSRVKNHEFQANLTYNLNCITPGSYVLQTTMRDKNSAKSGSFETAIEIVE